MVQNKRVNEKNWITVAMTSIKVSYIIAKIEDMEIGGIMSSKISIKLIKVTSII